MQQLAVLLVGLMLAGCARRAEDELWLIPKGHVGWLVIIPNQPDGVDREYEDGRLVLRFPTSGVLKTKFCPNYGVSNPRQYYTVGADGIRTSVFYSYNGDDLHNIRDGDPYLFFGFTASIDPFPYPEFFAIVMKVKGREHQLVIPKVEDFLMEYRRKTEASNQALQTTPMTRSVCEKTIEFGHPQRGV